MSLPREPIRVSTKELYAPQVNEYLEQQSMYSRATPEAERQPLWRRILLASYFYLSIAGGFGAFCAWAAVEPFYDDAAIQQGAPNARAILPALLFFPSVSGSIGLFLGAVEGLICRNVRRAAISALVGLGVGFGAGIVAIFPVGIVYALFHGMAMGALGNGSRGLFLLLQLTGRGLAWSMAAITAGIGQGIAVREPKVIINGLIGGVLGGLLGGLLFDPIEMLIGNGDRATLSRAVGFVTIGVMVGLFVGLVEQFTKSAWLLMCAGPLAGKQFVIFRNPTVIGSSPKADVYLFKDEAIEPRHAFIYDRGGRFEIQDAQSADGTYVNGYPIKSHILQPGDKIVLGKTVLEFELRETK